MFVWERWMNVSSSLIEQNKSIARSLRREEITVSPIVWQWKWFNVQLNSLVTLEDNCIIESFSFRNYLSELIELNSSNVIEWWSVDLIAHLSCKRTDIFSRRRYLHRKSSFFCLFITVDPYRYFYGYSFAIELRDRDIQ